MPKYVVLYTAPVSASEQIENNDPAAAAEGMKLWNEWAARAGGGMVDLGLPLGETRKVTADGNTSAQSDVAGYSILEAPDMEGALGLLKGHPHLMMPGFAIEVHETLSLPGM